MPKLDRLARSVPDARGIADAHGVAAALALGACADNGGGGGNSGGLFDRLAGGDHVHGDSEGVTVTGLDSAASALPLAIGHCSHFRKSAQYAGRQGDAYLYRCVQG